MDYDSKDMLISSDFPLDKVIYIGGHQVTLGNFENEFIAIPHNLGFTPLVTAQWSTDANFSVAYGINGGPSVGADRAFDTSIDATGDVINLLTQNRSGSSATIYYRIFAFVPSNVNPESDFTSVVGDDFIINTDYNYMKLFDTGVSTIGVGQTVSISHGLGYYPRVMVWHTFGSGLRPHFLNYADESIGLFVRLTTTELILHNKDTFSGSLQVHYRIYSDEA